MARRKRDQSGGGKPDRIWDAGDHQPAPICVIDSG
jgi:hypothetical protein